VPTSPPPALRSNQRGTRQQSSPWPGDRGFESISLQRSVTSKEVLYELPREVWDNDRKSGTDGSNPVPSREESDANLFRKSVVASRTKCRLRDPVPPSSRKFSRPPPSNQIGFRFWSWVAGMREQSEQYLFGYLAATPVAAQVALMDDRGLPTSPRKWGEVNWARPQPCHRSTARLKRSPERAAGARGSDRPPFRPS